MNPAIIADVKTKVQDLFRRFPELSDDASLCADVLEGETDFHSVVDRLVQETRALKSECEGLKEAAAELVARAGGKAERIEAIRGTILGLMEMAGLEKLKTKSASVSVQAVRPSIVITDETLVPKSMMKVKREPNKSAIKAALDGGATVPGAMLSNGSTTIRIA